MPPCVVLVLSDVNRRQLKRNLPRSGLRSARPKTLRCFFEAAPIGISCRRRLAWSSMSLAAAGEATAATGLGPLLDSQGKEVDGTDFGGKSVALYFAGEWCPMCRAFTPELTDFMKNAADKTVVFVSSDFTKEESQRQVLIECNLQLL